MGRWKVDVDGAAQVLDAAGTHASLRPKERAVVAALALLHPSPASVAELAELMWREPPATAHKAIHNHVSRLRRAAPGLVEHETDGYRFGPDVRILAPASDHVFADLVDRPETAVARTRFRSARLRHEERVATGRLAPRPEPDHVAALEVLVEREPHRVDRWRLLVVALARSGRRRDALEQLRRARHATSSRPGNGALLDRLERAVLEDDPRLEVEHFLDAADTIALDDLDVRAAVGGGADLHVDAGGVLAQLLDHVEQRTPGCTLVVGPIGSGKSTLCLRARDRLATLGWECHRVGAQAHGAAHTDIVSELTRTLADRRATVADVPTLDLLVGDGRRRLIVVDDLHHASPDEVLALRDLIAATADDGQVAWLVASRRDHDLGDARRLAVPGWERQDIEGLLVQFVPPSPWLDDAVDWLATHARGNALEIRELAIELLRSNGSTTTPAGRFEPPGGPGNSVDGIRSRLAGLDVAARLSLAGAAMVGTEFSLSTLARFADDPFVVAADARLAGVVDRLPGEPDRFRFTHERFRDTLLDDLDDRGRSEFALLALRDPIFDDDEESRRRAKLARLAAARDPELAVSETIEAARLEVERHRPVEAERLLRLAVELLEHDGGGTSTQRRDAMLALGTVGISNGSPDAIGVLLDAARAALDHGDASTAVGAVYQACRVGLGSSVGGVDADIDAVVQACRQLPLDAGDRARLDVSEMALYGIGTDGPRARALLESARESARESGDPEVTSLVLRSAYMSALRPVDLPLRRSISAELRANGERTGDVDDIYEATRLDFSISIEAGERDPRPLLAELERMHADYAERSRNWSMFSFLATTAYLDGDPERLRHEIDRILSPETVTSLPLKLSTAGAHQLGLHLLQGDVADLDPLIAGIEESTPGLPAWTAARARTAAAAGDHATARDRLRASRVADGDGERLVLPDDFTGLPAAFLIGDASRIVGDIDTLGLAVDTLAPFSGLWVWHGTGTFGPVDLALARWKEARGDGPAVVTAHARRALESAATVGAPHLVADAAAFLSRALAGDADASPIAAGAGR